MSTKTYHLAKYVRDDGAAVALCAKTMTPIDLRRATWTNRREAVTCKRCLSVLRAPGPLPWGGHGEGGEVKRLIKRCLETGLKLPVAAAWDVLSLGNLGEGSSTMKVIDKHGDKAMRDEVLDLLEDMYDALDD